MGDRQLWSDDEEDVLADEDINDVEGRIAGEGVDTPRALAIAASR